MPRTIGMVALAVTAACPFLGQPDGTLTFEVASIKPSDPRAGGLMPPPSPLTGSEWRVSNITVKDLVMAAYNVRDFQVSGGPAWISTARYEIAAKAPRAANADPLPSDSRQWTDDQRQILQEQQRLRIQALLASRFHLEMHRESKDEPLYALVVGKNGSKLRKTTEGSPDAGRMRIGRGVLTGRGVPLQVLTDLLSIQLGRPVRDQTGLKGKYDIDLEWTPDPALGTGPLNRPPPGVSVPPANPDGPSLFAAVEEQLGLRLESQKGPVETIVIDRVEKPSEN